MTKMPVRYPIERSPFYGLSTRRKVAKLLNTTERKLQLLYRSSSNYHCWDPTYSRGKVRSIQSPISALRRIHERVRDLLMKIEPPAFLFCPVKRKSYIGNAAQHAGAQEFRTLDVRAYFPSTLSRRVYWFFSTVMGCTVDVSAILAKILTVDGHLATGSPASPILSFYAFYDTWTEVENLTSAAGCKLTLYVDDVTVSGASIPRGLMWTIQRHVYGSGLRYHKQRHFGGGIAQITGIVIRKGGGLSLPHRQHQKELALRVARRRNIGNDDLVDIDRRLAGYAAQRAQIMLFANSVVFAPRQSNSPTYSHPKAPIARLGKRSITAPISSWARRSS